MSFILSCLTDSPSARRVLRASAIVAKALNAPVRFVHFGSLGEDGHARLNALIAEEVGADQAIEVKETQGQVAAAMIDMAREGDARMIIMGALSREKVVRDLVGSTARRVARQAHCSVMLVSTIGSDPASWSRFIVGVDSGTAGRAMADNVLAMARHAAPGAEVCFALEYRGVGRLAEAPKEFGGSVDSTELAASEQYQLSSFMIDLDVHGVRATAVALAGRPGQEIARYAEDTRTDVVGVVAPNRSLGFLDRLLSHPIIMLLDRLPCSVLLYRSGAGGSGGSAGRHMDAGGGR